MANPTEATFERAVEVLRSNSTKWGVRASASYYNQVWARDSFISFLGSNMLEDVDLLSSCRRTIDTLAKTRSPLGQIADFYNPDAQRAEFGFSGATDSSTWYIIGLLNLFHYTESRSLLGEPLDAALDAYRWLRYQDANNTWLIDSPPGADWMDAAIRRTGKTLYNNILFLMATRAVNRLSDLSGKKIEPPLRLDEGALSRRLSEVFLPSEENWREIEKYWPYFASRVRDDPPELEVDYYAQFVSFSKLDMHFDTLSNLLCVLAEVAPVKLRGSIIQTIKSRGLPKPYPVRVLDPPYQVGDDAFDVEFNKKIPPQHRSDPYDYHNGAVWPFVGGFYVLSLQRSGDDSATSELLNLARANSVFRPKESTGFNEWLNGRSGEPLGQIGQSWSAGTYIAAYLSSRGKDHFRFVKPGCFGRAPLGLSSRRAVAKNRVSWSLCAYRRERMNTRIFFVSDLHGSDRCFRKFINAAKFYKADALILGGDITGKVLVPIVQKNDGSFSVSLFGKETRVTRESLGDYQAKLRDSGQYCFITTEAQMTELSADKAKVEKIFSDCMLSVLSGWVALAGERLQGTEVKCYISPGNDDRLEIDGLLTGDGPTVINPENKVVRVGEHEMITLGYANPTPWKSPREVTEDELGQMIESLAGRLEDPGRSIFNLHVPPYGTEIDKAPAVDEEFRYVKQGLGAVKMISAGSTAVRSTIEKHQPLVGLHGHIHESKGFVKIGRTLCLNPGSEYSDGILRGALLNLEGARVKEFLLTSG